MPVSFRRTVAIGDPQASFGQFMSVLTANELLGSDGRLRADVRLVSIGDHFDWGRPEQREQATSDGLAILAWLAAHPPAQVTILAGNHDLARVCELAGFDDETFRRARAEADAIYRQPQRDEAAHRAFVSRWPALPDAECAARDFSCYSAEQRDFVTALLLGERLQLAAAHDGVLLVHAGVTVADLSAIGIEVSDAGRVAEALNAFLRQRVAAWRGVGALDLEPLHRAASAVTGEGRGALYHRPSDPTTQPASRLGPPPRRRFDPRELPGAFSQVIGHIRDAKCRELMPHWSDEAPTEEGRVRSLSVSNDRVSYQATVAPDARLYFIDGGLHHVPATSYELFDLDTRRGFSAKR